MKITSLKESNEIGKSKFHLENETGILGKNELLTQLVSVFYLCFILLLTACCILELKHTYQIDIFPFLDTPFDNFYFQIVQSF